RPGPAREARVAAGPPPAEPVPVGAGAVRALDRVDRGQRRAPDRRRGGPAAGRPGRGRAVPQPRQGQGAAPAERRHGRARLDDGRGRPAARPGSPAGEPGPRPLPTAARVVTALDEDTPGVRRAWGWVEHLRRGGTTPWRDWSVQGPARGRVLPGAQQLELLRRVNLAVASSAAPSAAPSAALVERIVTASAPGRGRPDLELD